MSNYNLSDNVNESFEFSIGGVAYIMRYPLVEELETLQTIVEKNQKLEKEGLDTDNTEFRKYLYEFITPKEKDSVEIGEVLKKQNLRVMVNFNNMVKTEFGMN